MNDDKLIKINQLAQEIQENTSNENGSKRPEIFDRRTRLDQAQLVWDNADKIVKLIKELRETIKYI